MAKGVGTEWMWDRQKEAEGKIYRNGNKIIWRGKLIDREEHEGYQWLPCYFFWLFVAYVAALFDL